MEDTERINEKFIEEYTSEDAVRKYTTGTAGYGINYLLRNDYAQVYLKAVKTYLKSSPARPLRLLEFGCGAGMNIIHLVSMLEREGIPVERAYGTDFSPRLVQSAEQDARASLTPEQAEKVSFHVARNERLAEDLAAARGIAVDDLIGHFDLIVGVNTFRYCHRLGKDRECAVDICRMLRPGGVCVNIDMNDRFPVFRSKFRGRAEDPAECYVPTLEEYAAAFHTAGFELIEKKNFCWVPHSAGRALTFGCRLLSPILNVAVRSRAMRSLIVARKIA